MELPKYLQTLLAYKAVLAVGLVVAVMIGFFAAFAVVDQTVVPRNERSYRATSTLMLSNPTRPIYQAQFPAPTASPGVIGAPESRDLNSVASVYAYIISGAEVRAAVVQAIGPLREGESIQASQRTTQPGADAATQGRLSLPLIDVSGTSDDPLRAERIAAAADAAFQDLARAEQKEEELQADQRVNFTTLNQAGAVEQDGSNPLIPATVAGLGVMILVALLVFVLDALRGRRRPTPATQPAPHAMAANDRFDDNDSAGTAAQEKELSGAKAG